MLNWAAPGGGGGVGGGGGGGVGVQSHFCVEPNLDFVKLRSRLVVVGLGL